MHRFCIKILILLFFIQFSVQGQVKQDKVLHFAAGAVSGAAGAFIASKLSKRNRFWTVTGAVAASLLAGITKEAFDEFSGGKWRNADVAATVLGGVTVGVSIDLFSKKSGKYYVKRKKSTKKNRTKDKSVKLN
jgi:putative lipoprotein